MKKTLLALAVSALSVNAFAATTTVNLNANPVVPATFASEIKVASTGTDIGATNLIVTAPVGFTVSAGYVRVNLDNGAKFASAPQLAISADAATPVLAAGGAGENYAIFSIAENVSGTPIASSATATLTTGTNGIKVVNKGAVTATYALYETAGNATSQTAPLSSKAGTIINFASALAVTAVSADPSAIDAVSSESKLFASTPAGKKTDLIEYELAAAAGTQLIKDGSADATITIVDAAESEWKITGNFSAVATDGLTDGTNAFTVAEDKQSATLLNAAATGTIDYTVTGSDLIAETSISATYTPVATAPTDYEISSYTFNNVVTLAKNGQTEDVDLALKPGGAYSNFVRISNKDTIAADVQLTVINDAGDSVTFPLGNVAGQATTVAGGASTAQMSIVDIYAAAQAKDATFATGEGKLRLQVFAPVADEKLSVQTYTVSKDGNSFATF